MLYHKLLREFGAEKARLYLEANRAALEEYRVLCRDIDCDFGEQDAFVYSCQDCRKLDRELEALALENAQNVEGMYLDEDEKGLSFRNYGNLLLLPASGQRAACSIKDFHSCQTEHIRLAFFLSDHISMN